MKRGMGWALGVLLLLSVSVYVIYFGEGITGNVVSLDRGMVGHLKFEGNFNDEVSGNINTGIGDSGFVEGVNGQAVDLDGDDDYIKLDSSPDMFKFGTGSFTASVWINVDALGVDSEWGSGILRSTRDDDIGDVVLGITNDGRISYLHWRNKGPDSNGRHLTGKEIISTGKWHHIVVMWDQSEDRVYLDGNEIDTDSSTTSYDWGYVKEIGRLSEPSGSNLDGKLDEVKTWRRALSEEEIKAEFSRNSPK